jgi:hypothetical protein
MKLIIRTEQMKQMGDARPGQPNMLPCADDPHWVEFQLVDQDGNPVPAEPYTVRLPDQSISSGMLDQDGKARFDGIVAGQASICFTGLDTNEWRGL